MRFFKQWFLRLLGRRHGGLLLVVVLSLGIGLATRLMLLFKSASHVSWDLSLLPAFAFGFVYDLGAALWWALPLALLLAILPRRCFESRSARVLTHFTFFAIIYVQLFGAAAEWFFWDEFGVRFNFIAVDYLVYTTEVIGNIRESYPLPAIFAGLAIVTGVLYALFLRTGLVRCWLDAAADSAGSRWRAASGWVFVILVLGLGLNQSYLPSFANNYNRELAKNGLWSFVCAFRANQLDYDQFYPTLPGPAAWDRMHAILARDGARPLTKEPHDLLRLVQHAGPEQKLNVIQLTIESLSANFLSHFGNAKQITPNLDALIPKSLVFDNFYATGNRTDRGMEALTLSVPPTPGRSLVKRPHNEKLFTLGAEFRSRGYETAFIYGGFGYFDNMNYFFGQNGYRIVDRTKVSRDDITFANVWGACDEDLFRWTLREADTDYAAGKPFFYFVMTTSNHRPFTFPAGKIDLPSKSSGRAGGVKYTDYAIGEFIKSAAAKPWFTNTVFVIVADHCASSAGKTELPVQKYHIPLLIYAPGGQVQPGIVKTLSSQVDYAPTLLGLLNWTYPSRFYGWDILALPDPRLGRALIGNYQELGIYQDGQLGILKPLRQSLTMDYNSKNNELLPHSLNQHLIDDAIVNYQTASWLFKHAQQKELASKDWSTPPPPATPLP